MRSGTSWFNGALYRKDLQRFWPLWGLWSVIWLVLQPLLLYTRLQAELRSGEGDLAGITAALPGLVGSVSFTLAFLFGVGAAMAVFSYLYTHRSACMMHALPLRRETLFFTSYLAGLSFLLLPLAGVSMLTALIETAYGALDVQAILIWLAMTGGSCLFFYSFAVFCAMFTGNLLALPAFYCVLSFLVSIMTDLMGVLARQFLYGFTAFDSRVYDVVNWLTPLQKLWEVYWLSQERTLSGGGILAAYAAAALLLAAAALAVYRRRQVETAGDVVAVAVVRPVFKYGFAYCVGVAAGLATLGVLGLSGDAETVACVLLWALAGYFAAEMLLKKTLRVLRAWKGAVGLTVVLSVLVAAIWLDLPGYSHWVPTVDQVAAVEVRTSSYPSDSGADQFTLTDKDQIKKVLDFHQAVVAAGEDYVRAYDTRPAAADLSEQGQAPDTQPAERWSDYTLLDLTYTLADGRRVSRTYYDLPLYSEDLETPNTVTWAAGRLVEDREISLQAYGLETARDMRVVEVLVSGLWRPAEQYMDSVYLEEGQTRLFQAVLADFDAGNLGTRYLFDDTARRDNTSPTDLEFSLEGESYTDANGNVRSRGQSLAVTLTPQASNTIAVLEELGILTEETPLVTWSEYRAQQEEPVYWD